jgi:hypothetical protein
VQDEKVSRAMLYEGPAAEGRRAAAHMWVDPAAAALNMVVEFDYSVLRLNTIKSSPNTKTEHVDVRRCCWHSCRC